MTTEMAGEKFHQSQRGGIGACFKPNFAKQFGQISYYCKEIGKCSTFIASTYSWAAHKRTIETMTKNGQFHKPQCPPLHLLNILHKLMLFKIK